MAGGFFDQLKIDVVIEQQPQKPSRAFNTFSTTGNCPPQHCAGKSQFVATDNFCITYYLKLRGIVRACIYMGGTSQDVNRL